MTSGRKAFFWVGARFWYGVGGILLLLCVLLLSAPLIINLDSVHREIKARFDQETGGHGTFQKLDLFFLPRPHAVIRGGRLSFPGKESLVFEALTVYPKLLPLIKGEFLPAHIQLTSPHTDIDLSSPKKDKQPPTPTPETVVKFQMPEAFRTWINKTDGLTIQVEKGLLNLTASAQSLKTGRSFRFSDINISAENASGSLILELTCASNLFQNMNLKGQMELASFKTKGRLTLSGFKTGELPDHTLHHETMRVEDGVVDLQTTFEGMGFQSLKANVNLSAPSLGLSRSQRKITVKGARIDGNIQFGKGFLVASLSDMTLDYPPMNLSGVFKKEDDTPRVSIHLEGKDVDVPALRSCALDLAGDISPVKDIFEVIRDGNVPSITVDAKGKSLADLGNLNAYTIEGLMRKGKISLTDPSLNLMDVEGSALISNGILSGGRLRAKLNKIKGTEGILTVALKDGAAPFHLNIQVDADLAEAHTVLKRLITEGTFAKDLHHIQSIEGQAAAQLKLDQNQSGLLVDVNGSSCRLKAHYRSLPLPMTVKSGRIHYRENHIQLRELTGTYGQSEFFIESGLLDWKNKPQIEIASAKATVLMEQVYPLISAMEGPGKWLKKLDNVKGRVSIHSLTLKGPLKTPAAWQYQTDLQVEKLFLNAAFLPGPLKAQKARLNVNTGGIRISNAEVSILDADFSMAGKLAGPVQDLKRFETTLSGTLGPQGMQYLYETLELPEDFLLRTPLTFQSGRALWEKDTSVSFGGDMLFPDGPSVSMDVSYGLSKLNIRNLVVEDDAARASLAMLAHEELVDLNFSGKCQKSTLDGIFVKNHVLDGWIEGDISARVLPMLSFSTSAEGFLTGKDIPVYPMALPARIEDFSLHAEGQRLRFDSVRMVLGENRLAMNGTADLSTEDPRFDVDISTDNVNLDKILAFLKKSDDTAVNKDDKDPWHFPVRGTAHLMWDSLKIGGYTWQPFQGEIIVGPEGIRVTVENARLCGISSPGVLRIKKDGIGLNFRLKAEKRDLNQSITCLTHKRVSAEGTFDLEGKIKGEGNWNNLFEKLEGPIVVSSAEGRVKQDPALAQVLSVLSVTDIFKGKLPTLEKDGFPYDLIQIKANLKNGKIHMQKGLMNSPAMDLVFHGDVDLLNEQLDLTMLASPFTLTDRLIRFIPVVGYILGGTLISVPVKIDGPLKDPKVRILPFSEIGSGVWGILKRTLETPVKIVGPFVGEEEKTKDKEDGSIFW
jgi:hypothetical protein